MRRGLAVAAAVLIALLMFAATATAAGVTLGITTPPTGAGVNPCSSSSVYGQATDDPSSPYLVPTGATAVTQWQTYAARDTLGDSITLLVLHPSGVTTFTVVASDTETLPRSLPASGIATFTPAHPLTVAAGDTFALTGSSAVDCYFFAGSTPKNDSLFAGSGTLPATIGETITDNSNSPAGGALDLGVTVTGTQDAAVKAATIPATVAPGALAVLSASVTNAGPMLEPITFVDQVPTGLQIQSASSGLGTCAISGQTVTCTIGGLAVGQSVPVAIAVTTGSAGSYTNNVSVSDLSGITDPATANNAASGTLTVAPPVPPRRCIVPRLPRISVAAARTLLTELGCRVRVSSRHSTLAKGLVIRLLGRPGSYRYRHVVTLAVSLGVKPRRRHR